MAQNNSTLYLLEYNNYYNRIVKRHETLAEYLEFSVYDPLVCNFNPADGIDTEHIFNIPTLITPPSANYVLVCDGLGEIVSRWFIVNSSRLRGGQYRLVLHRDLMADFRAEIISAPAYIERAMLSSVNKLIYNPENMTFNQIKQDEILLKDKSGCPWIVGYMANNYYEGMDGKDYVEFARPNISATSQFKYSYSKVQEYIAQANGKIFGGNVEDQLFSFDVAVSGLVGYRMNHRSPGGIANEDGDRNSNVYANAKKYVTELGKRLAASSPYLMSEKMYNYYFKDKGYIGQTAMNELKALNGQYIQNTDATGPAFFSINLENTFISAKIVPNVGSLVYDEMKYYIFGLCDDSKLFFERSLTDKIWINNSLINTFEIRIMESGYNLSVSEQPASVTGRAYLGSQGDAKLKAINLPYTIFCMPYGNINVESGGAVQFLNEANVCLNAAAAISSQLGGGAESSYIWDLQLLPYCPVPSMITEKGTIDITGMDSSSFGYIKQVTQSGPDANIGIILFVSKPSFSFTIPVSGVSVPADAVSFKIDNETKFCRLVSPNYAGAFEFKPTKNGGFTEVEVNCSYKPFAPYIHVNPLFSPGYMYGGDFNDNRGLICGGDFSLPQTTDAWRNFQIQNKSYMEAFDRQIENMDRNYNIEREQKLKAGIANVASSTISGGTSGAMIGSLAGPIGTGVGAAAGAVVSGAASAYGLYTDLKAIEQLQDEAMSYAKDQFNMSLQNIQALPNTMSRTSAFDINNKLFPFIEFYNATDVERQALRDKIKYNSMTVNVIGTISDYTQVEPTFIQGQIIRLPNMTEDYHLAAAIANEFHKGVYI